MSAPATTTQATAAIDAMAHLIPWWGACYLQQMRDAVDRWELAEDFDDQAIIDAERAWLGERMAIWSTGALLRMPAPIDRWPGEDPHEYAGRLLDFHCYGSN